MNNEEQIQEIEINIEASTKAIELMEALTRLHSNPDYKKVMIDGYFKDECVRLVLLKADYEMRSDDQQNQINKSIDAIGHTGTYLRTILQIGAQVNKDLRADKETKEELLAEQH